MLTNYYSKMKLTALRGMELDPKFFKLDQSENRRWRLTPMFCYKMANVGIDLFRNYILTHDSTSMFTIPQVKEVVDYESTNIRKAQFKAQFTAFDEQWQKYREDNPDEFVAIEYANTSADGTYGSTQGFSPSNVEINLQMAVESYVACKGLLGVTEEEYKENLPKATRLMSASEFADKHKIVRSYLREKLGIPDDELLTVKKMSYTPRMLTINKLKKTVSPMYSSEFALPIAFVQDFAQYVDSAVSKVYP